MTLSDLVYRTALSALWSAGHRPSRSQRINMQSKSWRHSPAADWPLDPKAMSTAACGLLREFGYDARPSGHVHEMLPEVDTVLRHSPAAGHAVRIVGEGGWMGVKPGDLMTLSSNGDRGRLHIGRGHHYMTEEGSVSLSSGGPGSMIGLRTGVLGRTDETVRMGFWRFHGLPEANGGVEFSRPVPVWTWDGSESSFDDLKEIAECL